MSSIDCYFKNDDHRHIITAIYNNMRQNDKQTALRYVELLKYYQNYHNNAHANALCNIINNAKEWVQTYLINPAAVQARAQA
jgi:hypothetical protein